MKLSEIAIKNQTTTFLVYFLILVAGFFSYRSMEKAEDPGFSVKTAAITTYWPGATPKQMQLLVSDQIAEVLQEMPELDYTESKNREGISTVYFNASAKYRGDELIPVWNKLRKKIYIEAAPKLPKGVIGPIVNDEFGDVYGTLVAVSGYKYSNSELYKAAYDLRKSLLTSIPQISKININGIQKQDIYIDYDNEKLSNSGITIDDVKKALESRNIVLYSGDIFDGTSRIYINTSGNFKSVEDISNTVISSPKTNSVVYLKDISTVSRMDVSPATYITKFNGKDAIVLSIALKEGEDNVKLGKNLTKYLGEYKKSASLGVDYQIASFEPDTVHSKIVAFITQLIQAVISVIIVMLLFLGLRTSLIITALIPTTIAATFIAMPFLNQNLNQMTLAGLIISLGMLVDNAIVMSETIMEALERGIDRMEACTQAVSRLYIPLFISSLTTMAAFLPLPLVQEMMGEYVGPLSVIVMITLFASWVISMTLIPALCYHFLKVDIKEENFETKTYSTYRKVLISFLKHKKSSSIFIVGMFIAGLVLLSFTKKQFMPDSNDPVMFSVVRFPVGTSIEKTELAIDTLNDYIEKNYLVSDNEKPKKLIDILISGGTVKHYYKDGIISWSNYIGAGAPKYTLSYNPEPSSPEYAYTLYNVTDYKLIDTYKKEIDSYMQKKFPDIEIITKIQGTGDSSVKKVSYRLYSNNLVVLKENAEDVKTKLNSLGTLKNISEDWNDPVKGLSINIDQERLKMAGLSSQEVSSTLESALSGVSLSTYINSSGEPENRLIPISFRSSEYYRNNINRLKNINIFSDVYKKSVPLSQVATVETSYSPGFIHTRDRLYDIEVSANLKDDITSKEVDNIMIPWLDKKISALGYNYRWELGGENEGSNKNTKDLVKRMPIGGLLILLLLVAQFNSIKKALIILTTIPLGIFGVSIGLLLLHVKFGFMPLIGIMSLSGMVVNDAIVLIDSIGINEASGMPISQAIIESCQRRFRPILLTTVTTVFGLSSLLIAGGPMFQPIAVAQIFGLMAATLLTLGVVPILYSILFKVDYKTYNYKPLSKKDK